MTTPLGGLPQPPLLESPTRFTTPWAGWLSIVQQILQATSSSGPISQRPTKALYVGQFWFDTTLGLPVYAQSLNPTVWVPATPGGGWQTLFYLLNFQPAVTQAADVQLINAIGNIPNRWVAMNLLYYMKSATPMTGANQILRLYEGPGKTGQQISGGDFGTIAAGNQPVQTAFEDNAVVAAINTGSNQPFYPTSTSQTLYASMSAAGLGGSGAYDIYVQGLVLPFGP